MMQKRYIFYDLKRARFGIHFVYYVCLFVFQSRSIRSGVNVKVKTLQAPISKMSINTRYKVSSQFFFLVIFATMKYSLTLLSICTRIRHIDNTIIRTSYSQYSIFNRKIPCWQQWKIFYAPIFFSFISLNSVIQNWFLFVYLTKRKTHCLVIVYKYIQYKIEYIFYLCTNSITSEIPGPTKQSNPIE